MRRSAWAVVCALVVALPAVRSEGSPKPPLVPPEPVPPAPLPNARADGDRAYKAPKADGPVVELIDESIDTFGSVLNNDGNGEPGAVSREDRDVFAGVESLRVTPHQKYRGFIPGWDFKIVETPKNAGEFRYVRFAWKKSGGTGMMIQFHDRQRLWGYRYYAGRNVTGWSPAMQVSATMPREWEVVTRDLFKEYGAFNITGVALSPLDGSFALVDHMLLGRTIADLDKATDAALGRVKPKKALDDKERETYWAELMGTDRVKAAAAQRAFLASAEDQVGFIRDQLAKVALDKEVFARIQQLLKDLDADQFDVRDNATDEIIKLGDVGAEAIQTLVRNPPNDEVKHRVEYIQRKLNSIVRNVSSVGRTIRALRILERADTADAKALLQKIADGEYGFDIAPEARAVLVRLKTK
jgi:hypothetical protein